jgi:hypothetical protein
MPENIKALAIILIMAIPLLMLSKVYASNADISPQDYIRRTGAWLIITAAAFLAYNFWIFIAISAAVALITSKDEKTPLALFITLLFAAPTFSREVTGLGLAKQLITLDYVRLITLVILLPTAVRLFQANTKNAKAKPIDICIIGFLAVQLALRFSIDSATNTIRYGLYAFIDAGLPYYVASRSINNFKTLKQVNYVLWFTLIIVAAIAVCESLTNTLLYSSLKQALNVTWGYGNYLARGATLRAQATTGQPIVLGYLMAIGLTTGCFVVSQNIHKTRTRLLSGLLFAGLISSISRGPWIGAAAGIFTYIMLSTRAISSVFKAAIMTSIVVGVALNSPWSEDIVRNLPFVGTVEVENITYRQNLLEFAVSVIANNPFFGAYDYLYHPALQSLRQESAGGLIDVVNTYIGIAMANGLVGLSLFVGAFLLAVLNTWFKMRRISTIDSEDRNLGRSLIASIASIMVTIFTTSSITVIPVMYWIMIGLCASYSQIGELSVAVQPANGTKIHVRVA